MIRVQTNVVLRYCEPLDEFVRIRLFTADEARQLLASAQITDKRRYVALVLNACLPNFNEQLLARAADFANPADRLRLEQRLLSLCIEVNPSFDLQSVVIPVPQSEAGEIHLLEQHVPEEKRDYRRLQGMEGDLSRQIVGQDEAVSGVCRAVRKAMTGLRDPERPIATFFFVGQTGVGKTELAKALTRYLFEDPNRMLRVDCSEYALPHEYAKLVGAPPGYIGHDAGGLLAEASRRKAPLILFDEVEKSDAKVHHLLLQLMDEGFVTDNKGQRLEFRDAILILTSNLGADEVARVRNFIGFGADRNKTDASLQQQETLSALQGFFRPEFINRLTDVVVFKPLGLPECEKIAGRLLDDVRKHAAAVPLALRIDSAVPRFIAERAFRPEFGAREIRRTVEREVESPLSDLLVEGRVHEGDRVTVRIRRHRLDFHKN